MAIIIRKEWFGGLLGDTKTYNLKAINKRTHSRLVSFFENGCEDSKIKIILKELGLDVDLSEIKIYDRLGEINEHNKLLTSPVLAWLEITNKCNLSCSHCFSKKKSSIGDDYTRNVDIINNFEKMGVFKVTLTGGEPLLCENIDKYINLLNEHHIGCRIFTSGVLGREKLEKIKDNIIDILYVSFDGIDGSNDTLRGEGSYSKSISSLKYVTKNLKYVENVVLSITIHRQMMPELEKIFKLAKDYGIKSLLFRPLFVYDWAEIRLKNKFLWKSEIYQVAKDLNELSCKYEIEYELNKLPILFQNKTNYHLGSQYNISLNSLLESCSGPCVGGSLVSGIKYDGTMIPCGFVNYDYDYDCSLANGNCLPNVWEESANLSMFRRQEATSECSSCDIFEICRGGCIAHSPNNNSGPTDAYCIIKDTSLGKRIIQEYEEIIMKDLFYIRKEIDSFNSGAFYLPTHNIVTKCGCPK